tara:strand:+ start:1853 stop:2080 length:228 start_codon:yes stop_codon:yes gene_type:complete
MNKKNKARAHKVGLKHGLPDKVIEAVVNSPFDFMRETTREMNELESFKNFRIINLGILYTTERRLNNLKKNDNNK